MKANKIQLYRIKQKCECTFFEGRLGKKFVTEECKFCKRNKPKNTCCTEPLPLQKIILCGVNGKIKGVIDV
jgi:hypothetical protein